MEKMSLIFSRIFSLSENINRNSKSLFSMFLTSSRFEYQGRRKNVLTIETNEVFGFDDILILTKDVKFIQTEGVTDLEKQNMVKLGYDD